jgi:hypothetical protein
MTSFPFSGTSRRKLVTIVDFPSRKHRTNLSLSLSMAQPPPLDTDDQFDYLFKIVLIGDAGVGKTCVVQRFKTGNFLEKHGSTIGVDFTMKTLSLDGKRVKVFLFIDTFLFRSH